MKNSFMIAATGSGCGKTYITCGLLEALKGRGEVRSFKCGPDYIDPMFHKNVLGIPSKNLDLFFVDRDTVKKLFMMSSDGDISVVEGVMGLYDGMTPYSDEASSYDLASALDIPVILVIDAKGMARSLIALIKGFLEMDREKRIAGIILNRMSAGYYSTIKPVIENELGVEVLGYFPEKKEISFESRYLGLKLPSEVEDLRGKVSILAEEMNKTIDLDRVLEVTRCEVPYESREVDYPSKVRIAIARDEAFCFYYEDNLRMLREAGAELVQFSPLHDSFLPEDISGIILGVGYPEVYAEKLSANTSMLESLRKAFDKDIPSIAECGGFMYLHEYIKTEDGVSYPMVGVIETGCEYKGHLVRFGYVNVTEKEKNFLPDYAPVIKGHEFHYYDSDSNGTDCISSKPSSRREWESSFVTSKHWWGFTHLYYPSNPEYVKHFVSECMAL